MKEFYTLPIQKPRTVPLYRFRNDKSDNNFFTVQGSQFNKRNYKAEGIFYYVYPKEGVGLKPIYRYYSQKNIDHYKTDKIENFNNYV